MLTSAALPPEEGIGYYVLNLSRQLVADGHQVTIVTRGAPGRDLVDQLEGVPVVRVRFWPVYPVHVQVHGLFVRRLLRRQKSRFDLVHAHTPLPPHPPPQFPLITTVHTPMRADGRSFRVRSLRTLANRAQGLVSQATERALFRRSQVIVAVASSVARELSEYGLEPDNISVVGNAVDADLFRPSRARIKSRQPTIVYCGRLGDRKGLDDLIEAFAIVAPDHPGARVVLAGKGPAEPGLRKLASRLGIGRRVEFAGHIPAVDRERLVRLYQDAAIYVQPSHYEGLPTALLEAMASELPCVATAVSGHLDIVAHGQNGLLVPAGQPRHLADALRVLLADPFWAAALGTRARQDVVQSYTWRTVATKYVDCYQDALRLKQPPSP